MMNPKNRTGGSSLRILAFYFVTFLFITISIAGSATPTQFSSSTAVGLTDDIALWIDDYKGMWPIAVQSYIESMKTPLIRGWYTVMGTWITAGSEPRSTLPTDADAAPGWKNQFIDPHTSQPYLAADGGGKLDRVRENMKAVTWFVIQKYVTGQPAYDPIFVAHIEERVQTPEWSTGMPINLIDPDTGNVFQANTGFAGAPPTPPFSWYPDSQAATPYVPEPKPADLQVSWEFEWRGNSAAGVYVNIEAKVKNIGTGESSGTSCWFGMEESMNRFYSQTDFREFDIPPGGWVDYTYSLWVPFGVWTKLVIIIQNDQGDYIREESRDFYAG